MKGAKDVANKVRQKTVTRALSERANGFFKAQYPNDTTRKAFAQITKDLSAFAASDIAAKARKNVKHTLPTMPNTYLLQLPLRRQQSMRT